MPYGWEDNRRSGVTLAMRHRLQWFIHLRAQGLGKGDEHPAYSPRGVGALYTHAGYSLYFTLSSEMPHKNFSKGIRTPI